MMLLLSMLLFQTDKWKQRWHYKQIIPTSSKLGKKKLHCTKMKLK